jgi:hypothetical protein
MRSHWEHHREVRKTAFSDHGYVEGWQNWRTRNEIGSLVVVASVFGLAFYPFSPLESPPVQVLDQIGYLDTG